MKLLSVLAALALVSCGPPNLNNAQIICKDDVQYLAFTRMDTAGHQAYGIVPHFKPNGTLYTCGEQ